MALGGGGAFGFGVIRRDPFSSTGVLVADRGVLCSRGVTADSSVSPSSSPKDNLLFASNFFFFFFGGPSLRDVEFLHHNQLELVEDER